MYELPWFKTETNIFSNRKIQILLKLPEGDTYFRVWIQLIALAVECNNKGRLEIGENNPMTIQNFSKIMGKSNKKIEKILKKFLELEMLIKEGETFLIKNWDKYQSIEKYEKYQMQGRERQRRFREKHKSENEKSNVTKTLGNAEEKNTKDIENKKEENIREESENGFRLMNKLKDAYDSNTFFKTQTKVPLSELLQDQKRLAKFLNKALETRIASEDVLTSADELFTEVQSAYDVSQPIYGIGKNEEEILTVFEKENQLNDEQELLEEKQSQPSKKKKMKMEE